MIRGITIGSRSTKPILNVALSTLNQASAGPKDRFKEARLIDKKSSCIGSVEESTIQTPMAFQPLFVQKNQPTIKKTPTRLGGIASVSRLLISKERVGDTLKAKTVTARTKIASGMKKAFSLAETKVKQSDKLVSLRRKLRQDSQTDEQENSDVKVELEITAERSYLECRGLNASKYERTTPTFETQSFNTNLKPKRQLSMETPTECLTCEELIHCNLRSSVVTESAGQGSGIAPCRVTAELSSIKGSY